MKVVIVGGSAPSAAQLAEEARDIEFFLTGRDASHVDAVVRAFTMLANDGVAVHGVAGEEAFERVLPGCDVVILQARYGGLAAREYDESFPLAFGIPGDEGLGPGGFANAWRSWPHISRALQAVARVAPTAYVVLMTAPLGILVRCAHQEFPSLRLAGLCELPYVTLADACRAAHVPLTEVRFSYGGVNHLGWFDDVRTPGGAQLGPLPLKYMRMHEQRDAVVAEQFAGEPRARAVRAFAREAYACFATGDEAAIRRVLALRNAPWYRYAVAPLLEAMKPNSSRDALVFLTTRNDGYLPELSDDTVLERPFMVRERSFQPVTRSTYAHASLIDHVRKFTAFEGLAADAVVLRSRIRVAQALRTHPWVGEYVDIDALVQAVTIPSDPVYPSDAPARHRRLQTR